MKRFLSFWLASCLGGMVASGIALSGVALGVGAWTLLPALLVGGLIGIKSYKAVLAALNGP